MILVLILALLLAGTALTLVARAALLPRIRTDRNVGRIAAYGYGADRAASAPSRKAVLPLIAAKLGRRVGGDATGPRQTELRKLLLAAGLWETKPAAVLGYRVLATTLLSGLVLWSAVSGGWSPLLVVIACGYTAGVSWIGPMFLLKGRARRRTERVELELPELIDLMIVTLEAGVGFNAALQRCCQGMHGPLGDEIRLTLREHNLGLGMDRALGNFLERCDVPAVRAFVRSVVQSEALGVSIGQVMRDLATDMRKRRRQIIEEKAQKAPIKMLFPLAFLILPALLMIVLYPGLYSLLETLNNTG